MKYRECFGRELINMNNDMNKHRNENVTIKYKWEIKVQGVPDLAKQENRYLDVRCGIVDASPLPDVSFQPYIIVGCKTINYHGKRLIWTNDTRWRAIQIKDNDYIQIRVEFRDGKCMFYWDLNSRPIYAREVIQLSDNSRNYNYSFVVSTNIIGVNISLIKYISKIRPVPRTQKVLPEV